MVAIRRTNLNSTGEFSLDTWIANLGLSNLHSSKKLAETWHYCEQKTKNHPEASLLLWRGLEMVEILATLSMDNDSLCAALLFPLVNANLLEGKTLSEKHGKDIAALIRGVPDMDAIRQLRAVHHDATNANQVDNVRRMLLEMVEDFRCVVIKLAEKITQLREVKNAPEEERLLR